MLMGRERAPRVRNNRMYKHGNRGGTVAMASKSPTRGGSKIGGQPETTWPETRRTYHTCWQAVEEGRRGVDEFHLDLEGRR